MSEIDQPHPARPLTLTDLGDCLRLGIADFRAAPLIDLFFAGFFVIAGLLMLSITLMTGTTYWLVLAVLGFPLVGSLAALGFYETSRRRSNGTPLDFSQIVSDVWAHRTGQLPWLATIVVVVFLFWFFLGHMIFALFLGLSPMTNVSSSVDVLLTYNGVMMLLFGTFVGAVFATVVYGICVLGMPTLLDRNVDFVTAMIGSIGAVARTPVPYLIWGIIIAAISLVAMLPLFLGLFIAMPVLGHASWHLYRLVSEETVSRNG